MMIELDTSSSIPIYTQLRNQIVLGIGRGELKIGSRLPTVRQLAAAAGVNVMTVNKVYAILRAEGFIEIDRRHGAMVRPSLEDADALQEKCSAQLELLIAESRLKGMSKKRFLDLCENIYEKQALGAEG